MDALQMHKITRDERVAPAEATIPLTGAIVYGRSEITMSDTWPLAEMMERRAAHETAGNAILPFGPYYGCRISTVPAAYLRQLVNDIVLTDYPTLRVAINAWLTTMPEPSK